MEELYVQVAITPEATKNLEEAKERFYKATKELEGAALELEIALRRLGNSFVLTEKED